MIIYKWSFQVGKLRINKIPGQKPDVNFTLADSICAPVAGLNEFDKNALVSKHSNGCISQSLISL